MRRQFTGWCGEAAPWRLGWSSSPSLALALAGLVALLGLVDDVDPALATNQLVVAVTAAERLQRVADLHVRSPAACPLTGREKANGGRDRDRTCDHCDVNTVLYR